MPLLSMSLDCLAHLSCAASEVAGSANNSEGNDADADADANASDNASPTHGSASSKGSSALPKRKKGQMGLEERKSARAAAKVKSEQLTAAVRDYVEQMEEMVTCIAKEQDVTPDRIWQLAGQVAAIKDKRVASNWNVLIHIKSKELNADRPSGSKFQLAEIQNKLYEDEDLMYILNHDKVRMAQLREEYEDDHSDKQQAIMRVSSRSAALIAGNSINACQGQMNYVNDNTGAWGFGAIICGAYSSTVQSGFFGRGDIDGFMRKHFQVSIQEMVYLLESYACTTTTMANKKVPTNKMQSLTVEMILTGLCLTGEVSKINNLTMSYARYDQDVRAAQGVMIEGWPEDVEFIAPSKLKVAIEIQTLYNSWKSGEAHWRVMTAAKKRAAKQEVADRGSHKRRRKEASDDKKEDDNDNDDDEADYQPKKSRSLRALDADGGKGPAKKGKCPARKSKPAVAKPAVAEPAVAEPAPAITKLKSKCIPKRKSDADEQELPSKKSKGSKAAPRKAAVPLTDKEKKLAALKKKRTFRPGSKAAIVEEQMNETRHQLEEMRRDREWASGSHSREDEDEDDESDE
ncbi:hypothetical protein BT96DRAFT_949907 [Gymnopus androsaceus JB14]|uniref:Uncharacterized protein n=1 Tax=Gymnopus androsaceus JB14 TaxID=1447944 RepID=A0A6A4GIZ3_9AGAR|nr:hypothetical protein BT96DRAFT_949907 [Gymnopus androsaceus JB14]